MVDQDALLAEQLEYYRQRAPEYDRWWRREGRFFRGEEAAARWFAEAELAAGALQSLPLRGARVLELAPGTGIWTERLVDAGASVLAVDGSPEMVAECRERLGEREAAVDFEIADLFSFRCPEVVDGAVLCHWVTHVPDDRLVAMFEMVAEALRPGGFVFLLDGLPEHTSTAADHVLPTGDDPVMIRRLDDGREFQMLKRYRSPDELTEAAGAAGIDLEVRTTSTYFLYGLGTRRPR